MKMSKTGGIVLLFCMVCLVYSHPAAAEWGSGWGTTSSEAIPASAASYFTTPAESSYSSIFTVGEIVYNGDSITGVSFGSSTYAQVTLSDNWVDPVTSNLVPAGSVFYINTADISVSEIKSAGIMGDVYAAQVSLSNGDKVWGYMKEYSQGVAGAGNHEKTLLTDTELSSALRDTVYPEVDLESMLDGNPVLMAKIGGYDHLTALQKAEWQSIFASTQYSVDPGGHYNSVLWQYCYDTNYFIDSAMESAEHKGDPTSLRAIEFVAKVLSDDSAYGKTYVFDSFGGDKAIYFVYTKETKVSVDGTDYTFLLPAKIP